MKYSTLFLTGSLSYSGVALASLAEEANVVQNLMESSVEAEKPIVRKFAGNIYSDEYFTESVYYDYVSAFWQGYNMQTYLYA